MNLQFLADGLIMGALIGLGAIGVTLTYSILRFANFAHGEFLAWGTYVALILAGAVGTMLGGVADTLGPLSFGWSVVIAGIVGLQILDDSGADTGKITSGTESTTAGSVGSTATWGSTSV